MTKPINKTNLWNVNRLIDSYMQYSNKEFGNDHEMSEMYAADRNDFIDVRDMYRAGWYEAMAIKVSGMDTAPREDIVIALAKDVGASFVRDTLGWEVSGWV